MREGTGTERRSSPWAVAALIIGTSLSVATTCGPGDPVQDGWTDTGRWDSGSYTDPDYGFTTVVTVPVELHGAGATQAYTIRTALGVRCTAEVEAYAWGYPGGWVLAEIELKEGAEGDTGADTATPPPSVDDTGVATDTGETSVDTGRSDTGSVDTGGPETGALDTGGPDTGWSDTGRTDTGSSDTGSFDTGSLDTGSFDTGVLDTGGGDTGSETGGPDTSDTADTAIAPIDTGFWGWDTGDAPPAARVKVTMVRADAGFSGTVRLRMPEGGTDRDSTFDEAPFSECARDTGCEQAWTVTLTLVEGVDVSGELAANVRLRMCSSGPPDTSDLVVTVE